MTPLPSWFYEVVSWFYEVSLLEDFIVAFSINMTILIMKYTIGSSEFSPVREAGFMFFAIYAGMWIKPNDSEYWEGIIQNTTVFLFLIVFINKGSFSVNIRGILEVSLYLLQWIFVGLIVACCLSLAVEKLTPVDCSLDVRSEMGATSTFCLDWPANSVSVFYVSIGQQIVLSSLKSLMQYFHLNDDFKAKFIIFSFIWFYNYVLQSNMGICEIIPPKPIRKFWGLVFCS